MFTKHNTKQKVYKTKQQFTNTLCLQNKIQNKSLQARYVYKTKQMFTNTLCLLNTNLQVIYVYKTKQKFTYKLYLQNKIQNRKFTKQN